LKNAVKRLTNPPFNFILPQHLELTDNKYNPIFKTNTFHFTAFAPFIILRTYKIQHAVKKKKHDAYFPLLFKPVFWH